MLASFGTSLTSCRVHDQAQRRGCTKLSCKLAAENSAALSSLHDTILHMAQSTILAHNPARSAAGILPETLQP